jgi:hypothetical protein
VPPALVSLAAAAGPSSGPAPPEPALPLLDGRLARCSVFLERLVLPATDDPGLDQPRGCLYAASYRLPGMAAACPAPAAPAAPLAPEAARAPGAGSAGAGRAWGAALAHCGVHWVAADGRLARALARYPLTITAARQQPVAAAPGARRGGAAGTGGAGAGVVEVPLGTAEVDLTGLLLPRPGRAEPATRCGRGFLGRARPPAVTPPAPHPLCTRSRHRVLTPRPRSASSLRPPPGGSAAPLPWCTRWPRTSAARG